MSLKNSSQHLSSWCFLFSQRFFSGPTTCNLNYQLDENVAQDVGWTALELLTPKSINQSINTLKWKNPFFGILHMLYIWCRCVIVFLKDPIYLHYQIIKDIYKCIHVFNLILYVHIWFLAVLYLITLHMTTCTSIVTFGTGWSLANVTLIMKYFWRHRKIRPNI